MSSVLILRTLSALLEHACMLGDARHCDTEVADAGYLAIKFAEANGVQYMWGMDAVREGVRLLWERKREEGLYKLRAGARDIADEVNAAAR